MCGYPLRGYLAPVAIGDGLGKGDVSLSRCIPHDQGFDSPWTRPGSLRAPCDP